MTFAIAKTIDGVVQLRHPLPLTSSLMGRLFSLYGKLKQKQHGAQLFCPDDTPNNWTLKTRQLGGQDLRLADRADVYI